MGLIGTLLNLTRGKLATKGNAPGQSVVMTGEGGEGQTMNAEVYQAPGVLAIPGDGSRGVWLPIGGSSRYGVVVAMHNYALNISIEQGETVIYSTDAAGSTVKSKIVLKADGTMELNGNAKRLVTWDELNTALQGHTHAAGALIAPNGPVTGSTGAPSGMDLSGAKSTTIKTGG